MRLQSATRRGKKTVIRVSVRGQISESLRLLANHVAGWAGTLQAMEGPEPSRKPTAS